MPKCPFCKVHIDTGVDLQNHLDEKHPDENIDFGGPRKEQRKRIVKKKKRPLVIDGNCIATLEGDPKVVMIKKARSSLVKLGFNPYIYVTPELGSSIDDNTEYNRIKNLKWIIEVENLVKSMAEMAKKKKCMILTNENYAKEAKNLDGKDWKLKSSLLPFSYEDSKFAIKT